MSEREVREPLQARVSSHGRKEYLERRKERLLRTHPGAELQFDVRSGLKFDRPGFLHVLRPAQERRVSRVVVIHEDRLARFGADRLRQNFAPYGTTLDVMEAKHADIPERELAQNLMVIIPHFSARFLGLRSHKTKQLLASTRAVLKDT